MCRSRRSCRERGRGRPGSEGDAIGEEDDGIDGVVSAEEMEGLGVAGGDVEEVLEGGGREVEEGQAVVAKVVGVVGPDFVF